MAEHYTQSTIHATAWCKVCGRSTLHEVQGGKLSWCHVCMARPLPTTPHRTTGQLEMFAPNKKEPTT